MTIIKAYDWYFTGISLANYDVTKIDCIMQMELETVINWLFLNSKMNQLEKLKVKK